MTYRYIDLHCDTIYELTDHPDKGDLLRSSLEIDLEKLAKGGALIQDFALFVDMGEWPDPWARYQQLLGEFRRQKAKHGDHFRQILCAEDVKACEADGRLGAMLSIEEGGVLGGSLERLHQVYEDGVRLITLTWNYPNELAWPNGTEGPDKGLTEAGRAVVEEMGRLHMIVDTSHLNDAGTREVLMEAKRPPVASHSDARAVTAHSRNLPDDLLALFGEKGGLIGLNFSNHFLGSPAVTSFPGRDDIDFSKGPVQVSLLRDIVRHGMYIMDKAGEDVLCLGTDFDGIEPALEIRDASEMPRLAEAFLEAGATETQVEKIFSGNALRYLKDML